MSNKVPLTVNPGPSITSITPNSAQLGQTVTVTITASLTNLVQGATLATFGAGVSVAGGADGQPGIVTVTSPTTATVQVKPDATATLGARSVTVTTGTQAATLAAGFTVAAAQPVITSFAPQSGPVGTLVTIDGTNFGATPQVSMNSLNGGALTLSLQSISATSVAALITSGAVIGLITVTASGTTAATASSFSVTSSNTFTLTASPPSATLIQGQSVSYSRAQRPILQLRSERQPQCRIQHH